MCRPVRALFTAEYPSLPYSGIDLVSHAGAALKEDLGLRV
jgi:hypothetical protein